jgi:hypothetical protein
MHKFFGDSRDYVIESMYNSFDQFRNYIQTGRIGMFDGLSDTDIETVRRISLGKRHVASKIHVQIAVN